MSQILTPTGYVDIEDIQVGDEVRYYDLATGAPMVNIVERKEWIEKEAFRLSCAPQTWNDGDPEASPPTLKPEDIPFDFYRVNDRWTLYQDQSIWYRRGVGGDINVGHVKSLQVGDIVFGDDDGDLTITSIVNIGEQDGWWRFAISGDCSYIVDGLTLHNASRYWVGGGASTNWSATGNTNWSASSGGANNASVPTTTDQCFLDASSGSGTSNFNTSFTVQGVDCTNYAGTLSFAVGAALTCNACSANTLVLSSAMTWSTPGGLMGGITITGTSGTATIDTKGKSLNGGVTINGSGGTSNLASDLNIFGSSLFITAGAFSAVSYNVTCAGLASSNSNTRSISLGSGAWYFAKSTGSNQSNSGIYLATATNLTFSKGSANVVIGGSPSTQATAYTAYSIDLGGLTFNDITIVAPPAGYKLLLSNSVGGSINGTVGTFTIGAGVSFWIAGGTCTCTNMAVNGTRAQPCAIFLGNANTSAAQAIFSVSGSASASWTSFNDIAATGSASFTATNSFNQGNVTGITITPPLNGGVVAPIAQRAFKAGATSQSIDIFITNNGSTTSGSGLTGLAYNSSGLTCYYRKGQTGTATAVTLATQTVGGAYSSGGFVEISAANMPGMYRFDIPDTVLASAGSATLYFQGAANMVPVIVELEIVAYDPTNATDLGVTNIAALGTANPEPGQGAPPASATLFQKVDYLYKAWRNKKTQTATTFSLFDDAGAVVDQKSTISDDGTTFTSGEIGTGP